MKDRQFYTITAVQIVAAVALLCWVFTARGPWTLPRVSGAALMLIGIGGIAIARYQLGRSFAIRAEARHLVTHGLYSRIRNPIYVFGGLLFAGFALVYGKPVLWLLLGIVIIGQTIRARREARVLEATFGDAYREYRRKTWF